MTSEQRTPARVTAFRKRLKRLKKMEDEAHYRARGEAIMERLKAGPVGTGTQRIATLDEIKATLDEMLAASRSPKLKQVSVETIRDEIRKANADALESGEKYTPNINDLAKIVRLALIERNLKASYARIRQIAKEAEFTPLRGPVGMRRKARR